MSAHGDTDRSTPPGGAGVAGGDGESKSSLAGAEAGSAASTSDASCIGEGVSVTLRLRMSTHDAHYGGQLVDGARMLALFGDVATELLVRLDGDEGLFRAYDSVEFLAPVYAGDYIEASGTLVRLGRTSRTMRFEARKVLRALPAVSDSAAEVLEPPLVVCRASGTCVTPLQKQRRTP